MEISTIWIAITVSLIATIATTAALFSFIVFLVTTCSPEEETFTTEKENENGK